MENAEIRYEPDDDPTPGSTVNAAKARFERQFGAKEGVAGIGVGRDPIGRDAIVVYLRRPDARRGIGDTFEGVPVLTEVVGEIDAL